MVRKLLTVLIGLCLGIVICFSLLFFAKPLLLRQSATFPFLSDLIGRQVIGFLPYWLLPNAKKDYSSYITTLTYFGLRIARDGSILKLTNPQETEPGWEALHSGKLTPFFQSAQQHHVSLSLLLSAGGNDSIGRLINQPVPHAEKLVSDVTPVLQKYHFSDLNLDIEYSGTASDSARKHFTQFVQTVRDHLDNNISLTVEITGDDLIKKELIDPADVGKIADYMVIMAYDYHYPSSFVTGPVAPLGGAGTISEYDVTAAVEKGLQIIPADKIILGLPLYGYEWETLGTKDRMAVIPQTGVVASNHRAEAFVARCATCSARFDQTDQEMFVTYKDQDTGTYHQMFYPTAQSTAAKIHLANSARLGGLALWALGYEGSTILNPLKNYK